MARPVISKMQFIKTERGKDKLFLDGYFYTFSKELASGVKSWVCEKRSKCKARISTDGRDVVKTVNEHTHAPQPDKLAAAKFQSTCKERARTTKESAQQILARSAALLPESSSTHLPAIHHVRRYINNCRRQVTPVLPNPASCAELEIPPEFQKTLRDEDFLLFDSGVGDDERILLFSTQNNIDRLRRSPRLLFFIFLG